MYSPRRLTPQRSLADSQTTPKTPRFESYNPEQLKLLDERRKGEFAEQKSVEKKEIALAKRGYFAVRRLIHDMNPMLGTAMELAADVDCLLGPNSRGAASYKAEAALGDGGLLGHPDVKDVADTLHLGFYGVNVCQTYFALTEFREYAPKIEVDKLDEYLKQPGNARRLIKQLQEGLEHLSEQGIWHLAVPLTARQDETTPDDVTENQLGGSPVRGKTIRYSPEILEGMAGLSLLVRGILRLFNDTADTLDGKEPTVQLRQVRGNTVLNSLPLWINNLKHLKLNSSDGERELEYDLRIDSNPLLVVDDFLFREVLQNLVRNASDAMGDVAKAPATGWKPGICIHLLETSSESPEQAVILVSDTGTGIPRDRWDTLFVARKSTKVDATQGAAHMGEGMATCKALMALMGGDIEIVKPEEGYKTTFKLTLKTASHSEEVPPEPLAEPPIESEANRVIIDRVFEVRQILDEIKPYNDPFKRVLQNCATILGRRIGAIPIVPQAMPPTGERKYWRDDWEKLIECALKKDAQGVSETCRKIAQTIPDEDRQGDTPLINRFRRGFKKAIELVIGDPDSFIKIVESSRDLILQKMQP